MLVQDVARDITGAFVTLPVWNSDQLSKLKQAKGRAFAILHSPEDFIPIRMAEAARDALSDAKVEVYYATYFGGHGWKDDPYAKMRAAIAFLEEHHAQPPKRKRGRRCATTRAAAPRATPVRPGAPRSAGGLCAQAPRRIPWRPSCASFPSS